MDKKEEENEKFIDFLGRESKDYPLSRDYSDLIDDLEQRMSELKTERSPWLSVWSDLASYISPPSGKYISNPTSVGKGQESNKKILSNMALSALHTLQSGMLGGLSSPTKPWFQLSAPLDVADDTKVKIWLSDCEDRMRAVMHKSNYYDALAVCYHDLGLFGTHAMIMYEDTETVIRCRSLPMGQYLLATDHRGEVTGLYREYTLTLHQMVKQYGLENVSINAQQAHKAKRGLETAYTIHQAIQPNADFDPNARGINARQYIDVTWEVGGERGKVLDYKGFRNKPFFCPRWFTLASNDYGESCPAMEALGDIKQLQYHTQKKMQVTEKRLSPPIIAHQSLEDQPSAFSPNGIIFSPNINEIYAKPLYQVDGDISQLQMETQALEHRINTIFRRDLWMMLDSLEGVQPRSQMELIERKGEKILGLSPVIEKVQSEILNPSLDRLFSIMFLGGLFDDPPEALRSGIDLKVEYISELAVAQNAKDTVPIEQFGQWLGSIASVAPEVLDKFDVFEAADKYGKALGIDPKIIRSTDEAVAISENRNKQIQQQRAMEQAMSMTQGAKTLSETNVGGGVNALNSMMGLGGA